MGNVAAVLLLNEAFEVVRLPFALATFPYINRFISRF